MLAERQQALVGSQLALAEQVHGIEVSRVDSGHGWPVVGRADVLVAEHDDPVPIGIWAADCAPILLIGSSGTVVAAHGGWRGLAAGVIDVAVAQFGGTGQSIRAALVGPVIHACCYEFGSDDLEAVAAGVHAAPETVLATTATGRQALDVPAAINAGFAVHGIDVESSGPCTGCDDRWFSHRVRGEPGRHAVIAWSARLPA